MSLATRSERRSHWAMAFGISTVLHSGAFAYVFDLLPDFSAPPPPSAFEQITVAAVFVPQEDLAAMTAVPEQAPAIEPEPEPEPEAAPEPEPIAPVAPEPETLAAEEIPADVLAPEPETVLAPVLPEDGLVLQGASLEPERLAAVAPETLAADPTAQTLERLTPPAPVPTAPPAVSPPPSEQDLALQDLIDRIRGRLADPCLVALPQSQGPALPLLVQLIAEQDTAARRFQDEVLSDPDLPVDTRSILIDRRQCPALTFLRERGEYPAFGLALGLAAREVASGQSLVGTIDGIGGAYTSLLLVDDNGVVQDLRRFMRFTAGRAEFVVPVTRDGPARETSQILIAIVTPDRPATIGAEAGQLAERFFARLGPDLGPTARLSVVAFDVR